MKLKSCLKKMIDHMVKSEKEVIEVPDEDKRPAANNSRGIAPFKYLTCYLLLRYG